MDGFDLAAKIQQSPRLAGASIMMLSSGARPGDRARCFELGHLRVPRRSRSSSPISWTRSPASSPPGRRERKERPRKVARPPEGGRRRLRVLVAEDNAVNQQVAVGMLERAGHEATVAANGREVLALLERETFDVVLMDVQMPELDGLEATAAIRERERATGGHLPIVALTAHAMKGDAERCLAAGMDAYLAKPLQPRELVAAIDGVLGPATTGAAASAGPRVRPARDSRRRRPRAAARARRGRPEGPGRARPDLPRGLAEAGRTHPRGRPGERRPARCGPPPTPSRGRCRTSPPRPRPRPLCACRRWAKRASSRARERPSSGWSGRSRPSSPPWPPSCRRPDRRRSGGAADAGLSRGTSRTRPRCGPRCRAARPPSGAPSGGRSRRAAGPSPPGPRRAPWGRPEGC